MNQIFKDVDGLINIREIDGNGSIKQDFITLDQLQTYEIPQNTNVFNGVYSRTGHDGAAKGCKTTGALWADFDSMDILQAKQRIEKAGLPTPSTIINSGHGIHIYWLLDQRVNDTTSILKAIAVSTGADPRATDTARIMRMPGSMNIKGEPVRCEVIENNSTRYSIRIFKDLFNLSKIEGQAAPVNKTIIPELNNSDRPCIRVMGQGVKEGHRNFIEGRLIKFLQMKGKTKEATKSIILQWNYNNDPPEDTTKLLKDFEAYWRNDYKLLGCCIDNPELQSILYDYCNRAECKLNINIGKLKLDNNVKYNNRVFNSYEKLSGNDLIALGVLDRHREGLTMTLLIQKLTARVTGIPCMSQKTLIESLQELKSIGLVESIDGNRRAGKENLYKAIPQGTFGMGYTIASNGAINGAIDGRVTPTEFKLYVLLLKYAFSKGSCYPSQIRLSKELRISQPEISQRITSLEKVDYIKKNTSYLKGVESLIYTLLV